MAENNYTDFPVLTTDHLIFRQLIPEDEKEIFILRSDATVNKYLDRPKAMSLVDSREFINKINSSKKNESVYWAIQFKDDSQLLGTICLWKISLEDSKAEIGYELLPVHQGKGIMKEAMPVIIKYAFEEMKLHLIEAELDPNNLNSVKLLELNGFELKLNSVAENGEDTMNTVTYALANKTI